MAASTVHPSMLSGVHNVGPNKTSRHQRGTLIWLTPTLGCAMWMVVTNVRSASNTSCEDGGTLEWNSSKNRLAVETEFSLKAPVAKLLANGFITFSMLNKRLGKNPSAEGGDVQSLYMDDGYLFFRVEAIETAVYNDTIDFEIRMQEGPQASIGKIEISGNDKTK
jgi:hypothetical protein